MIYKKLPLNQENIINKYIISDNYNLHKDTFLMFYVLRLRAPVGSQWPWALVIFTTMPPRSYANAYRHVLGHERRTHPTDDN
jgi:hypothetical protein